MTRLLSTMKLDAIVQVRNHLYTIGIVAGIAVAFAMSQLMTPAQLPVAIPVLMMLVVGGSTLLYVSGMIIFEKDEGTINMAIVSPLRSSEYLMSKIITLTTLATIESTVMIIGAMLFMSFGAEVEIPNMLILYIGIIALGVMYTLMGIIMIVRYDKITEYLIPMAVVAVIMQSSALYFIGFLESPIFLLIPVSAPTLFMQGAYMELSAGQWLYAIGYTAVLLIGMSIWAYRSFQSHIVMKVGS